MFCYVNVLLLQFPWWCCSRRAQAAMVVALSSAAGNSSSAKKPANSKTTGNTRLSCDTSSVLHSRLAAAMASPKFLSPTPQPDAAALPPSKALAPTWMKGTAPVTLTVRRTWKPSASRRTPRPALTKSFKTDLPNWRLAASHREEEAKQVTHAAESRAASITDRVDMTKRFEEPSGPDLALGPAKTPSAPLQPSLLSRQLSEPRPSSFQSFAQSRLSTLKALALSQPLAAVKVRAGLSAVSARSSSIVAAVPGTPGGPPLWSLSPLRSVIVLGQITARANTRRAMARFLLQHLHAALLALRNRGSEQHQSLSPPPIDTLKSSWGTATKELFHSMTHCFKAAGVPHGSVDGAGTRSGPRFAYSLHTWVPFLLSWVLASLRLGVLQLHSTGADDSDDGSTEEASPVPPQLCCSEPLTAEAQSYVASLSHETRTLMSCFIAASSAVSAPSVDRPTDSGNDTELGMAQLKRLVCPIARFGSLHLDFQGGEGSNFPCSLGSDTEESWLWLFKALKGEAWGTESIAAGFVGRLTSACYFPDAVLTFVARRGWVELGRSVVVSNAAVMRCALKRL